MIAVSACMPQAVVSRIVSLNMARSDCTMLLPFLKRCVFLLAFAASSTAAGDDRSLLETIAKTGPGGIGSAEARAARDELAQRGIALLPALVTAMDTNNPIAANWYRTIYEEITMRHLVDPDAVWPIDFLKDYVSDSQRAGRPRRLVLKLIDRLEPEYRNEWLSERLTDPEFRQDAIALLLQRAKQLMNADNRDAARLHLQTAFEHARDRRQVLEAADGLSVLGNPVDVIRHLGLVTDWWVAGPFDAPDKSGFALHFPPETAVDLRTEFSGQQKQRFGWIRHTAKDRLGQLNLVDVLGKTDEAVAYVWTQFTVREPQDVQLRCSADDCCLVWLNGEVVSAHEQWLNGTRFDRLVDQVSLTQGTNEILVKVCQGPQHRNPEVFNNWSLQLRLCDSDGQGIPFENALSNLGTP